MSSATEMHSPASRFTELPVAPKTLEESGLSVDLVLQLALKTLHFAGELNGAELSQRLGLNFAVIEPVLDLLIQQRQVEIAGGTMVGRASYRYRISDVHPEHVQQQRLQFSLRHASLGRG